MNSTEIRQTFLDFFQSKQHTIVPSAPMVVKNDPTLMFTNAGMNQFKDIFLGNKEGKYKRVADTQKCLRVSGKHNDLEEVGHDTYHHTMFEMLGNWSFGDYFKKDAIAWSWELLTETLKIDKDCLYVTVFEGDDHEGLKQDSEAYEFWKKHISEDHIIMGSKKDNFWEMGDTGPCGPCSEIHADIRLEAEKTKIPGKDLVNKGDPHVVEIWNLVFIQYNRLANGQLAELPAKHVDTGMGFERLCMVLQGKRSNYDTDVFQPIIGEIALMSGREYGQEAKADIAMRVIADHLRAIAFAIADGQLPSNVKAGYVIRRILRRAVRYGYAFLGFKEPFIHELIPVLVNQMGHVFPELLAQKDLVTNVIREEEAAFLRTLATGIQRFNAFIEYRISNDEYRISNVENDSPDHRITDEQSLVPRPSSFVLHPSFIDGSFAFELYDTFGFPIDLTELMAREIGWTVDMEEFTKCMAEQKARSRQDAAVDTSDWTFLVEDAEMPVFIGYDTLQAESIITRYRKVVTKGEEFYHIVLDKTPFYAESGGQVGDKGWLIAGDEKIAIIDTVRENELIIHVAKSIPANPYQEITASVDKVKRTNTANNHSATHLMHAALRRVLGMHVEQKGSLVDENRFRFDFTHFSKMTREEIAKVEALVNTKIRENIFLEEERALPIAQAKEMGAMALFGEKYGDMVRVIVFDPLFSVELCGGAHVQATGQIGLFKIISESGIAAGIRRIEGITAGKAEEYWNSRERMLEEISDLLKNPRELIKGVTNLLNENIELKQQVAELSKLKLQALKEEFASKVQHYNGVNFLTTKVDLDSETVKSLAYELNASIPDLFLVLATESEGKATLTVMLSENLVNVRKLHAGNIIRELAKEIQGGGGGQAHIATAGGKNPSGIEAALNKARGFLSS
ncbi:MAG: alanine--tRNA ligase [Bacteroidetes bacterium]|nr:alanine--tRNA ligase [Bacteroidota bacterium]